MTFVSKEGGEFQRRARKLSRKSSWQSEKMERSMSMGEFRGAHCEKFSR